MFTDISCSAPLPRQPVSLPLAANLACRRISGLEPAFALQAYMGTQWKNFWPKKMKKDFPMAGGQKAPSAVEAHNAFLVQEKNLKPEEIRAIKFFTHDKDAEMDEVHKKKLEQWDLQAAFKGAFAALDCAMVHITCTFADCFLMQMRSSR
jgi:hypothetical protein